MPDIIVKWLAERIGYIFDLNSDRFAEAMKSGILLAHIFYNYGIFSEEQMQEVIDGTINQLEVFKAYFKKMDINYDEEIHAKIASGHISTSIKLLYYMYLSLQNKDKLQHIAIAERKMTVMTGTERFAVTPVCEDEKYVPEQSIHPFSQPLQNLKHIVTWHKEKHDAFVEKCRQSRQEYLKQLDIQQQENKDQSNRSNLPDRKAYSVPINYNISDKDSVDLNYDQLIHLQKMYEDAPIPQPNPKEAKKLLTKVRTKLQRKHTIDLAGIKLKKYLLNQYWDRILKQQHESFETIIVEEALKQSTFEKQMVRKIYEIRQQKDVMYENRCNLDNEIKKKSEEEFCRSIMHADVKNQEKENLYYLEKYRALELHKRLYAERKRLELEETTEMCAQIVGDLADIAMYQSEYSTNYQLECSKMHKLYLSTLFHKEKPIFDLIKPIEDILQYDPDDCREDMEEIYTIEISRQDTIMEQLFFDYINLKWPWRLQLDEYYTPDKLEIWKLGSKVLGHIIHRLLLAKYPKPTPPPPPDLPNVPVAVCVNGLENLAIIAPLKEILRERKIEVIQMQDAINYCLKIFNEEATVEYTNTLFEQEERQALELEQQANVKTKGKSGGNKNKNSAKAKEKPRKKGTKPLAMKNKEQSKDSLEVKIPFTKTNTSSVNKAEQTPRLFPCEELIYSPAGELGRLAYNTLNFGELLNNTSIIKMFVQYLISLKSNNIGGWVLVNFPNTVLDAMQLEETLTSKPVPVIPALLEADLNDYVRISDHVEIPEDEHTEEINEKKRVSKLAVNPNKEGNPEYKCYLTAFIMLKQIVDENELEVNLIETPADPLSAFYFGQGCKYDLCFKLWDFTTLKTLAKLILGDYSLPRKKSVEILGPSLDYLEAVLDIPTGLDIPPLVRGKPSAKKEVAKKPSKKKGNSAKNSEASVKTNTKDKNKEKSTKSDKKSKSTKPKSKESDRGNKKVKEAVELQDLVANKETQIPEATIDEIEDIEEDFKAAKPGEENWNYIMCSIPEEYQHILATLWENIEEVYINDLKELFFRRRILLDNIVPYIAFIKTHMSRFISGPDLKQKYLHEYQILYNRIDKDMREDDELKAELHCLVFDLRNILYDICDDRMTANEKERQRLIEDKWVVRTIVEIINIKVTMMQIEIDTFVDKIRLISEYYSAMVTKRPTTDAPFTKYRLPRIIYDEETPDNTVVNLIAYIDQLLKSQDPFENTATTPFYQNIVNAYNLSNEFVNRTYQTIVQNVGRLAAIFKPKEAGSKKEPKPHVDNNKSKVDPKKMPAFLVPDYDVIEVAEDLIEEYKCVLEASYIEVQIRLIENYIASNSLLTNVLSKNKNSFMHIFNSIEERYKQEVSSVDLACSLLSRAIEAECQIQPQLVLTDQQFFIEPDVLLFEDALPKPDGLLLEPGSKYIYSIQQLQETFNILVKLSPTGYIPEIAFKYIIEDIITHNPEDGSILLVPPAWKHLTLHHILDLIHDLFGNVEYIDWRDYIIYNADVKYPNSKEILSMRHFYREMDPDDTELVYEHQYQAVTLWFEMPYYDLNNTPDDDVVLRRKLFRKLLWNCFRIDESRLNYTALLLMLCKGKDLIEGVAKALALSFGKEVCSDLELGEMYIQAEFDKRNRIAALAKAKQMDHEDTVKMSENIVKDISEGVLVECDSERLILEEIFSTEKLLDAVLSPEVDNIETKTEEDPLENQSELLQSSRDSVTIEKEFSNIEIGFEQNDFPNLIYILPFDGLMNVLTAALPLTLSTQSTNEKGLREYIEVLYESLRIPDLDNDVYVHRFLHSPQLAELLKDIEKFTVKCPGKIVFDMLQMK